MNCLACDLGAESGRLILGRLEIRDKETQGQAHHCGRENENAVPPEQVGVIANVEAFAG